MFLVGVFMALFVVYGFDTAGTFGEETIDASRQAPRGLLSAIWLSGIVGAIFLLAVTLSFQDMSAAVATGQAFGFPIADTIKQNLTFAIGGITLGDLYLVVILIAVYVCTLAIQGATTRLMFSMGRDRRLPLGGLWGNVNHTLRTPANAGIMVAILAAIPFVVTGAGSAIYIAIAATGMIYISYFLCNLGVLIARRRGWPHQGAWFNLGSWGTIINILALVWGAFMVLNIAIWTDPGPVRRLRQRPPEHLVEPVHQHVHQDRRHGAGGPAGLAGLRDRRRHRPGRSARSTTSSRSAASPTRPGRGRRRDRRGRHRLTGSRTRPASRAGRRSSAAPPARARRWRLR